jgi:hypothetical protein
MKKRNLSIPGFFIDSLPDIPGSACRELVRYIDIHAGTSDIYVWLKQLRIAPYSFDLLDNQGRKSPGYIIENLPPLKISSHFLLAFHICGFEENVFIAGRFCVPINPPVNRYVRELYVEYRIQELGAFARLWCRVKGWYNNDIGSKGFFRIFSAANFIMAKRQLSKIRKLSVMLRDGNIKKGTYDLTNYHPESGLLWWIFCRRNKCKGLISP